MVNFRQTVGLILLSIGMVLAIYSFQTSQVNFSSFTFLGSVALLASGVMISLLMNKKK